MLDKAEIINQIFSNMAFEDQIKILFGEELNMPYLEGCGFVIAKYHSPTHTGMLGVVGPSRLNYPVVIPTMRYFSQLLSEIAQKHLKDEGLEMVIKQFNDVLESEGVEEITAEGSPFDPNFHEAVEILESEKDGVVLKVLAKGYKINDKVLRPAQVAVGRTKVDHRVEDDSTGEKKSEELGDYAQ